MKALKLLVTILTLSISAVNAQFNWPEDKAKAQEQYTLMSDYLNQDNYAKALPHWRWLYKNAPDLDNNKQTLYIHGIKIFDALVKDAEDKELKMAYQDSSLMMYDERIAHGGDKKDVLNRKGYRIYPYWANRKEKRKDMYDAYKEILKLNGDESYYVNAKYFFKTIFLNKESGYQLEPGQIIEDYDFVNEIVENNIKAGGSDLSKWQSTKTDIDDDFANLVDIDCAFIEKNWVPKFEANPEDIDMAKKIFTGMLSAKCTDKPIWLTAGELINKTEPSYGLAKNLGLRFRSSGDYDKALKFFNEAENMAATNEDKAEIAYLIALVYFQKGSKSTARSYAQKAAGLDASKAADSYSLIGDLYMGSFNDCKAANIVDSRAVYIAAYNMYKRAGNTAKMASAKEQFPSIEEIFTHGKKEGDSVTISCWINETVTLERRPQ